MGHDFTLFEPLNGATPFRLLSKHPTEPFVALQVLRVLNLDSTSTRMSSTRNRSAIWDRETHKLVTVPEDALTLAWSEDGKQMGLIREYYVGPGDLEAPRIYRYVWQRFSWPEQKLLGSCDIVFPAGTPENLVFSPQGDLIVVQWFDADRSGLEFIERERRGDLHLDLPPWDNVSDRGLEEDDDTSGYLAVGANLATAPVFSPDGRYILFGWQQREHWWSDVPDDVYVEGELPVRVGECQVGNMQIVDWHELTTRTLPIRANLPRDWQPVYEGEGSNELLTEPAFIDNRHFQLKLPTGKMVPYSVLD